MSGRKRKRPKRRSSSSGTEKVMAASEERKVLIKAMMKAREEHGLSDAKVKGRFLFINNERYDSKSIPEYLKQPQT